MKNYYRVYILSIVAYLYLLYGVPSPLVAHEWMAPRDAGAIQNPITDDANSIAKGKVLYETNCAFCHGDSATGLNAEEVGLEKSPPNLIKRLKNHTDGDFFWKIQHGRGNMPAFKDSLQDEDIWNIINYIKSN